MMSSVAVAIPTAVPVLLLVEDTKEFRQKYISTVATYDAYVRWMESVSHSFSLHRPALPPPHPVYYFVFVMVCDYEERCPLSTLFQLRSSIDDLTCF
jgi:hypothetical protein